MTDNELIAEFIGIPQMHDYKGVMWDIQRTGKQIYSVRPDELRYHSSWDWLMPVVEKIHNLYTEAFPPGNKFIEMIMNHQDPIDEHYVNVVSIPLATPISEVYKEVISFIKWHNQKTLGEPQADGLG